jgi:uncharacterized protein YndB with AHSA1/START domain
VEHDTREFGSIEREVFIEASPEVVFAVISQPEHVRQWWPDEAHYEATPGATGHLVFANVGGADHVAQFEVLEVLAPHTFSFRWIQPEGAPAVEGNSLLVTFTLTPTDGGTLLTMVETGFREMGWEAAELEAQYNDHVSGWSYFIPRVAPYVATLAGKAVQS